MHRWIAGMFALLLTLPAGSALAQEVRWRYDYNAARKEAEAKGRPLVIDFGSENCMWCVRLDQTTFQDPTVVNLMNERFIPLKLKAEREATLVQMLQISSYPTIILGSPDGTIL